MNTPQPVDAEGFLINTGSLAKVQPAFKPLLDNVRDEIMSVWSETVGSLYIRGSISVGHAHEGTSDADFVVVARIIPNDFVEWSKYRIKVWEQQYKMVSEVDLALIDHQSLLTLGKSNGLKVNLATHSTLLAGNEILDELPKFKPDISLARYLFPDINETFQQLRQIFVDEIYPEYQYRERSPKFWCDWTMRTILRSASVLATTTTNSYHVELLRCVQHTVTIYPELLSDLYQAYEYSRSPIDDPKQILGFLDDYLPKFIPQWNTICYS